MPTLEQHIAQARRNEALSIQLQAEHPDWAVAILFYAALHYVGAFALVHKPMQLEGISLDSHASTIRALRDKAPSIRHEYRRLYDASMDTRYQCQQFSQQEINDLRDRDFDKIKAYVRKYLPPDLQNTLP